MPSTALPLPSPIIDFLLVFLFAEFGLLNESAGILVDRQAPFAAAFRRLRYASEAIARSGGCGTQQITMRTFCELRLMKRRVLLSGSELRHCGGCGRRGGYGFAGDGGDRPAKRRWRRPGRRLCGVWRRAHRIWRLVWRRPCSCSCSLSVSHTFEGAEGLIHSGLVTWAYLGL